jgi:hypothetical protein
MSSLLVVIMLKYITVETANVLVLFAFLVLFASKLEFGRPASLFLPED